MNDMGQHSEHHAAGAPYRRARVWAQVVFWLTAGGSVLYNCYNALVNDHMPWYTGGPEGCLPLLVAIGVLEYSGAWRENKGMQTVTWLVTGGAMAWSSIAINHVVHNGWAFGVICDAAALSAMYFLLNGPTATAAVAAVDRKVAGLTAAAAAERSAREAAQEAHRAAEESLRAKLAAAQQAREETATAGREAAEQEAALRSAAESELAQLRIAFEAEQSAREADRGTHSDALRAAREAAQAEREAREAAGREADERRTAEAERDAARAAAEAARAAAETAEAARREAERQAAESAAQIDALTRKLARSAGAKTRSSGERKTSATAVPRDFDLQAAALAILADEPGISGAKLAAKVGRSARWGETFKKNLATRPAGGEAPGE